MLSVDEARAHIAARVVGLDTEIVPLDDGFERILATNAQARRSLPPRDNSAMDGYAVIAAETPATLPIAAESAAGITGELAEHQPGTATRIMTGAPVPLGADAVVMRENVEASDGRATFNKPAIVGRHIRRAGEDIEAGQLAIRAGTRLGAGELGLLAALGYSQLIVVRRPKVAILSTGNELIAVTEEPRPDRIYNSNAHALAAQVREAGGVPVHCGIASDSLDTVTDAIGKALDGVDVVLTSGGVSVGDYDFVKRAFGRNGIVTDFWKVAVKPGKPLVFGTHPSGTLVFGLPGNPASSMVTFELFVRPTLLALQSATVYQRRIAPARLKTSYSKVAGRTHFLRARLERRDGELVATIKAKQGSGNLTTMAGVDGLVEIPEETTSVAAGGQVNVILVRGEF